VNAIPPAKIQHSMDFRGEKKMTDPVRHDETRELIASNKVEGTAVYDHTGERLGTIDNFMVDKRSGNVEYAILQFGGFLGIGADYYPIPWSMLNYDTGQAGYVVDLDKELLADAPRYDSEEPTYDADFDRQISSHYGIAY
jgi:sporulation protein YlmC with PRC-barrel domain